MQILRPLYQLVRKDIRWDWDETHAAAFSAAKWAVKVVQNLNVMDSPRPCELDVHVTEDGYGWVLWQQLERTRQPVGYGHNYGKKQRSGTPQGRKKGTEGYYD